MTSVLNRLINPAIQAHTVVYRLSRGLVGSWIPGVPPLLLLDHVGAKSGTKRTTPLAYMRDGEDLVIVASKGGSPRHPAWFHNLRANPETTIQVRTQRMGATAHVATPEERARLWPRVVDMYGGFDGYQRRTQREIPLVILQPRA